MVDTSGENPEADPEGSAADSMPDSFTPDVVVDIRPATGGVMSLTGLMHHALAPALVAEGFVDVWTFNPGAERVVETFRTPCSGNTCGFRVIRPADVVRQTPGLDVRRVPSGPGSERLVMLARDWTFGESPLAAVLAWDVAPPMVKVAHATTGFLELGSVTRNAAVVTKTVTSGDPLGPDFHFSETSTVVMLDAPDRSVTLADVNLVTSPFVLLGPSYLYNTEDLRFYVARQSLEQTALPVPLADVGGNPPGDYHVIALP